MRPSIVIDGHPKVGFDACPLCGQPKGKRSVYCNECRLSPAVAFWPLVDRTGGPEACWPWTGRLDHHGYGVARVAGRWKAYQGAYVLTHGPVPAGLELDHLCRNRRCCNPAHLEAVTHQLNQQRAADARLGLKAPEDIRREVEDRRKRNREAVRRYAARKKAAA